MSDIFDAAFDDSALRTHDDVEVRFPPGLGLIPPPQLARVPRPRRGGELAE